MSSHPSFNCAIIGGNQVGKQTYVSRFLTAEFEKREIGHGHQACTVYPQTFVSNYGPMVCNFIVQSAAAKNNDSFRYDAIGLKIDCLIVMFSFTDRRSYQDLLDIFRKFQAQTTADACIPTCLAGNKVDAKDRQVKPKHIMLHRRKNWQYYDISAKANYDIEKPVLWLIKRMTQNPDVVLVEAPALCPPSVMINTHDINHLAQERHQADQCPFPDSDEDDE